MTACKLRGRSRRAQIPANTRLRDFEACGPTSSGPRDPQPCRPL